MMNATSKAGAVDTSFADRYLTWRFLWLATILLTKCTWIVAFGALRIAAKAFWIIFLIVGAMFLNTPR